MKMIRKIIGWILVLTGGLWTLSAVLCAVFTLMGVMEGIVGILPRLGYTAVFLLCAVPGVLVMLLGWKVKGKAPKPAPVVQTQEAVRPVPKPESAPAPKPVPVKTKQGWLFTWETGPGLCHDRFPFAAYYDEDEGLDSFRASAACYVYNGYLSPEDTLRALAETESRHSDYIHVRFPSAGTLQWVRDDRYTQKLERADDVPELDLEWTEELRSLCREHGIRVVTYAGEYDMYDHVNNCRLHIHVETWYGSVDDAATYGHWSVVEVL